MQAILLAGGLGTRLRSVVNDRPKPMALINNKPFLEYLIQELSSNGIRDIILAIGYKGSMIEEYFQDGAELGVKIHYSYEDEPLGTAGAIKNASRYINQEQFFVFNADTFYKLRYKKVLLFQESTKSDMVLVLRQVPDISRYGQVKMDEHNQIIGFNEKSAEQMSGMINGGVYLMTKEILDLIPSGKCSLENEIIPYLINQDYKVSGIINEGYFIDIGIPVDYYKFEEDIMKGKIS